MKLIDLLVRELPKRGGWPEGMACACQSRVDGEIYFYKKLYQYSHITKGLCDFSIYLDSRSKSEGNHDGYIYVTRDQYQSALAASQRIEWSGEGLPPVGCECEARYREVDGAEWFFFRCVGVDCGVAFGWAGKDAVTLGKGGYEFRPICSEADKKRDAACRVISDIIDGNRDFQFDAKKIYDAIAAGKIPGVKLED